MLNLQKDRLEILQKHRIALIESYDNKMVQ